MLLNTVEKVPLKPLSRSFPLFGLLYRGCLVEDFSCMLQKGIKLPLDSLNPNSWQKDKKVASREP